MIPVIMIMIPRALGWKQAVPQTRHNNIPGSKAAQVEVLLALAKAAQVA